jgi:hypothetical protein
MKKGKREKGGDYFFDSTVVLWEYVYWDLGIASDTRSCVGITKRIARRITRLSANTSSRCVAYVTAIRYQGQS